MSKEFLTYTIEGQQVAEILGIQNFTTKEAAILELIKNAYDAGSVSYTHLTLPTKLEV